MLRRQWSRKYMKTVCRVLAITALVAIAATYLLLQQFDAPAETPGLYQLIGPLFYILATTASAVSFASGVVAMVAAGKRRQRVWFVVLLLSLILETYSTIAIALIPATLQFFQNNPADAYLRAQTLEYVIKPLFAPLAALI